MTPYQVVIALICVFAISCGQILFKAAGLKIHETDSWFHPRVLLIISVAVVLYGFATLLWIHLLKSTQLNKAYILMAISFVLVPLGSHFIYQELLSGWYFLGLSLVVVGLLVVIQFG